MQSNIKRVDAQEALNLWAEAEQKNKSVWFDNQGEIQLIYSFESGPDLKKSAVLNIVSKIQTEIREFAASTQEKSAEHLLTQLPSLGRFVASGKLGNLREEWQQLQKSHASSLTKLTTVRTERQNIFNEFKNKLPQMPTHFEFDGTAVLRNDFKTVELQAIMRKEIAGVNKYKLNNEGYYPEFIKDLPRTRWTIAIDGTTQSFGLDEKDEKLEAIKKVFGNDQSAISTASKIMNQVSPGLVMGPNFSLFPPDLETHIKDSITNNEKTYFHISSAGNCINFEGCTYVKATQVVNKPGDKNEKIWPVNTGEKWEGTPGPKNYGQLYRISLQIDKQAASAGILKPIEGTPIEALYEIRLCPSVT